METKEKEKGKERGHYYIRYLDYANIDWNYVVSRTIALPCLALPESKRHFFLFRQPSTGSLYTTLPTRGVIVVGVVVFMHTVTNTLLTFDYDYKEDMADCINYHTGGALIANANDMADCINYHTFDRERDSH